MRSGPKQLFRVWVALPMLATTAVVVCQPREGWKQAAPGQSLSFPADHASHPDYGIEWWYYSGNLDAASGRRFGYQLTFFRVGVDPQPSNPSRWSVRDLFVAHLAITDVSGRKHRFAERMNRGGPGLAGALADRYRVWNDDWSAALDADGSHQLQAFDAGIGLDLRLHQQRPAALHGERGYSRKGAQPGNASHYYSLTRMTTTGELTVAGERVAVTGMSWMDHEFGTSFLEPDQRGWDWLALQLDDGRDVMVYQLRRGDGSVDPRSSGTLVEPDGQTVPIWLDGGRSDSTGLRGFTLQPGRLWRSPATEARYPVAWQLHVPGASIDLAVEAVVEQQELAAAQAGGVSYWEGAIDVRGLVRGRPTKGRGYLEMTGYAGRPVGNLFSTFR